MTGDILDSTNQDQGFALVALAYSVGLACGPLIGGALYDPVSAAQSSAAEDAVVLEPMSCASDALQTNSPPIDRCTPLSCARRSLAAIVDALTSR